LNTGHERRGVRVAASLRRGYPACVNSDRLRITLQIATTALLLGVVLATLTSGCERQSDHASPCLCSMAEHATGAITSLTQLNIVPVPPAPPVLALLVLTLTLVAPRISSAQIVRGRASPAFLQRFRF
jgi:hypothetical protein